MAEHLDSVKGLAALLHNWAAKAESDARHRDALVHRERAEALEAMLAELEQLQRATQPIPASYGDLSDLPPELIKELSGIKADDREQQLYTIINSGDGEVELDAILIELFRRFKVVETRKFLQNKLWRMAQKGMIYTVPGKKGVYTADESRAALLKRLTVPASAVPISFDNDLDDDVPF